MAGRSFRAFRPAYGVLTASVTDLAVALDRGRLVGDFVRLVERAYGLRPALATYNFGVLVERLSATHGVDLRIRIGIASGPVMAGVIGADKFSYDVWGETVNLASRLESHGLPGEIQVCGDCTRALGAGFVLEPRGAIEVKGVGMIETWLLKEERSPRRISA